MSKQSRPATRFVPRLEQLENRILLTAMSLTNHRDGPSGQQDFHAEPAPRNNLNQASIHQPNQRWQQPDSPSVHRSERPPSERSRSDRPHSRRAAGDPPDLNRGRDRIPPPPRPSLPPSAAPESTAVVPPTQPTLSRSTPSLPLPTPPQRISAPFPTIPVGATTVQPLPRPTATATRLPASAPAAIARPATSTAPNESASLVPQAASPAEAKVASEAQPSFAVSYALSLADILDNDESEEDASEGLRFGGIIGFDNQPSLHEILPKPNTILGRESLGILRDEDPEELTPETNDDDHPLETLDDAHPDWWAGNDAEISNSANDPDVSVASETNTSRETVDPDEPRDFAFAKYDDIEEYGGIIEFAADIVFEDDHSTDEFEEKLARDRALQVDTIIGMAPLLELNLVEEESPAEPEAVLTPAEKRAAGVALALMPWQIQKDKRTVINNRVFLVD